MPLDYSVDPRTAILFLIVGNAAAAILLAIHNDRGHAARCSLTGRLAQMAGWMLFFHRPVLPMWAWYFLGNSLIMAGWMLEIVGLLSVQQRSPSLERRYMGLAVLSILSFGVNLALDASFSVINASISILLIVTFSIPAYRLLKPPSPNTLTRTLGWLYLFYAVVNVLRLGYALNTDNVSIMMGTWMHSLIFISLIGLLIVGNTGYLLLVAEKAQSALERVATTDDLTGLFNRRAFISHASLALNLAQRSEAPVSVLMLDIDHFKAINDTHGHGVGDQVLVGFAMAVRQCIRAPDVLGRLGGEEFAVLVMGSQQVGMEIAQRIRQQVEQMTLLPHPHVRCTVSIGVFGAEPGTPRELEHLLRQADQNLYIAKQGGRNQVVG